MGKRISKAGTKKKIIIVGARLDGHSGVVLETLQEIGGFQIIGFIDHDPELQNKYVNGLPVIGSTDDLGSLDLSTKHVHIAVTDNVSRGRIYKTLKDLGMNVVTLVHPSATVSKQAIIAEGSFIGPRAVINNGVVIGEVTIINTGAIIDHNNKFGYAVYVGQGTRTGGRVRIDDFSFIGMGATVLPDIHIGSGALIGPGATVTKSVSAKTTVMGYSAQKHNERNIYRDVEPDVGLNERIYVAQPTLPEYPLLDESFKDIAQSLMLSNFAKYASKLETETQRVLRVNRALTFPNGTSALMLAIKALGLEGEVILPSFTFSATGHAVAWNGLFPVFADIDPLTFNIDPKDVERKITDKTSAILGVHVFGNPADIDSLETIAERHDLKLIFDSAHALGSQYKGKPVGSFGDVECFSLSGTKVITSAEGGIATSDDERLMDKMRLGRNYGAGPDYDCQYIGLNGKMSEFHAAIALESLVLLEKFVEHRNNLAKLYKERLREIRGVDFQQIQGDCVSTFKDFAIIVDKKKFGMTREELKGELEKENIFTKKYFYPPLHRMKAYQDVRHRAEGLSHTDFVANNVLCLPIFSHMTFDTVEKICFAVYRIWKRRQ
ncbi:MAG: NeuD/PglB/VioB family sugar acetyltransferase [Candidatus Omnitrophota bacterium]